MAVVPFFHLTLRTLRPDDPGPEPISFSGAIRWRRKKLGLTQRALAERLGVTLETIRNRELGHTRPGLRQTPRVGVGEGNHEPVNKHPTRPRS